MLNPLDHSTISPESAKASLGIATHLQSMLLPKAPQGPQAQGTAQTSEPAPQPPTNQTTLTDTQAQIQGLESRIIDEIGALKEEIKKAQPLDSNKEIEALKKEIENVLNSND